MILVGLGLGLGGLRTKGLGAGLDNCSLEVSLQLNKCSHLELVINKRDFTTNYDCDMEFCICYCQALVPNP